MRAAEAARTSVGLQSAGPAYGPGEQAETPRFDPRVGDTVEVRWNNRKGPAKSVQKVTRKTTWHVGRVENVIDADSEVRLYDVRMPRIPTPWPRIVS